MGEETAREEKKMPQSGIMQALYATASLSYLFYAYHLFIFLGGERRQKIVWKFFLGGGNLFLFNLSLSVAQLSSASHYLSCFPAAADILPLSSSST